MNLDFKFKGPLFDEKKLNAAINSALWQIGEEMQMEMIQLAPVWHGVLGNSIELAGRGTNTIELFTNETSARYASAIDEGTEKHFVPFFDLSGKPTMLGWWASEHGFDIIKQHGLLVNNPHPFFQTVVDEYLPLIGPKVANEVVGRLS